VQKVTIQYRVDGKLALPLREVAEMLSVTVARVLQLVKARTIRPIAWAPGPGGKTWLFRPADAKRLRRARITAARARRKS
jgi:hypothetical protein